jgi:hypothetical protein
VAKGRSQATSWRRLYGVDRPSLPAPWKLRARGCLQLLNALSLAGLFVGQYLYFHWHLTVGATVASASLQMLILSLATLGLVVVITPPDKIFLNRRSKDE